MALVLVKESLYEYPRLREDVFSILSELDDEMIQEGSTVLVKPNFLAAAPPEKAVTTYPLVIRAAAEYALERGARVTVGDSNPLGSFEKVISTCGAKEALGGLPVTLEELTESRAIAASGKFATLELSARALDADVIISLPKLKTHAQMTLTLAVKNFFGCVVGMRKPEWHFRVGENLRRASRHYLQEPRAVSEPDGRDTRHGRGRTGHRRQAEASWSSHGKH
jgi:uncharacterized protein (DUF362 family)